MCFPEVIAVISHLADYRLSASRSAISTLDPHLQEADKRTVLELLPQFQAYDFDYSSFTLSFSSMISV
jgi:hypothetical protein